MKEPYITQDHHDNILHSIHGSSSCTTYKSCYSMLPANFLKVAIFTIPIVYTQPSSIPLVCLGLLHPRIPPIPPELLVRDPLAEDRPVDVRSDLKKESAYMNETKHNLIVIKNYRNCLRTWSCSKFLPFSSHVCRMNSQT